MKSRAWPLLFSVASEVSFVRGAVGEASHAKACSTWAAEMVFVTQSLSVSLL